MNWELQGHILVSFMQLSLHISANQWNGFWFHFSISLFSLLINCVAIECLTSLYFSYQNQSSETAKGVNFFVRPMWANAGSACSVSYFNLRDIQVSDIFI